MSNTVELLPLLIAIFVPLWCIGFVWFFIWKLGRDETAALAAASANFADALYYLGRRRRTGGERLWFDADHSIADRDQQDA